jgi:hypothetical protein
VELPPYHELLAPTPPALPLSDSHLCNTSCFVFGFFSRCNQVIRDFNFILFIKYIMIKKQNAYILIATAFERNVSEGEKGFTKKVHGIEPRTIGQGPASPARHVTKYL